jgi:uncharacterized integral membrane protein
MLFFLIVGLMLGAVTVIFALQNITTITVTFLLWQLEGSLALILALAVTAGVLISILLSVPEIIRTSMRHAALKKVNKKLEQDLAEQTRLASEANTRLAQIVTPAGTTTTTTTTVIEDPFSPL